KQARCFLPFCKILRERVAARSASPIGRSLKYRPGEGRLPKRSLFEPSPCRFAASLSRRGLCTKSRFKANIPLLVRRGGCDSNKISRRLKNGADGVVAKQSVSSERPPRPRVLTNY